MPSRARAASVDAPPAWSAALGGALDATRARRHSAAACLASDRRARGSRRVAAAALARRAGARHPVEPRERGVDAPARSSSATRLLPRAGTGPSSAIAASSARSASRRLASPPASSARTRSSWTSGLARGASWISRA